MGTHSITIAQGYGTTFRQPMTSYRAEGYGKLTWLRFIYHQIIHFSNTAQCNLASFCDNLAIVTTTQRNTSTDQEQQEFIGPPTRLDYDMLLEILKAQLALAKILAQLSDTQHIKGHQDRAIPFAELTRPGQLNIPTDDLATNHPTDLLAQETQ